MSPSPPAVSCQRFNVDVCLADFFSFGRKLISTQPLVLRHTHTHTHTPSMLPAFFPPCRSLPWACSPTLLAPRAVTSSAWCPTSWIASCPLASVPCPSPRSRIGSRPPQLCCGACGAGLPLILGDCVCFAVCACGAFACMVRRNVTCGCVLSVGRRYAITVASFFPRVPRARQLALPNHRS